MPQFKWKKKKENAATGKRDLSVGDRAQYFVGADHQLLAELFLRSLDLEKELRWWPASPSQIIWLPLGHCLPLLLNFLASTWALSSGIWPPLLPLLGLIQAAAAAGIWHQMPGLLLPCIGYYSIFSVSSSCYLLYSAPGLLYLEKPESGASICFLLAPLLALNAWSCKWLLEAYFLLLNSVANETDSVLDEAAKCSEVAESKQIRKLSLSGNNHCWVDQLQRMGEQKWWAERELIKYVNLLGLMGGSGNVNEATTTGGDQAEAENEENEKAEQNLTEEEDDQDETSKTMCNETMSNEEEMDNLSQFYGRIALRDEEADENGNGNGNENEEESMNEEESKNGREWTAAVAMSPQQNDNAEEEQPSPMGLHVVEQSFAVTDEGELVAELVVAAAGSCRNAADDDEPAAAATFVQLQSGQVRRRRRMKKRKKKAPMPLPMDATLAATNALLLPSKAEEESTSSSSIEIPSSRHQAQQPPAVQQQHQQPPVQQQHQQPPVQQQQRMAAAIAVQQMPTIDAGSMHSSRMPEENSAAGCSRKAPVPRPRSFRSAFPPAQFSAQQYLLASPMSPPAQANRPGDYCSGSIGDGISGGGRSNGSSSVLASPLTAAVMELFRETEV